MGFNVYKDRLLSYVGGAGPFHWSCDEVPAGGFANIDRRAGRPQLIC
jgi:hypothetical protein